MTTNHLTFLLDENINIRLAQHLQQSGYKVLFCPKGITDLEVLNYAQSHSAILITLDKDFANPDLYPPQQTTGIIVLRIHPPLLANLTLAMDKLLAQIPSKSFSHKLYLVSAAGIEIFE